MSPKFLIERADPVTKLEALALEEAVYRDDHGFVPSPEAQAQYFVARAQGSAVVASFRIIGPEARPFEFETAAPLTFLGPERIPALIGRLCVRKDHRSVAMQASLHIQLLRTAYSYGRRSGYTDFVQFTFPQLRNFYERALFQPADVRFFHDGYLQEMEILRLDLPAVQQRIERGEDRAIMLYGDGRD